MVRKASQLAKLSRPRLHAAVARERLFDRLDDLRGHAAVWVAGPPGSGKTMLVATYLERRKLPCIWYHVDAADADPSTFFYYLTEAARPLAPKKRQLPLLTPEYLLDLDGFTRRYFRELFARQGVPAALVLDNFQSVPEEGALHRVLRAALDEVPEGNQVVIISRTEPGPTFSRPAATEQLLRLGWEELRLTFEEARAIAVARGETSDATVEAWHTQTDGWVAGLTLMLERAQRGVTGDELRLQSHQAVFGYFASQIFDEVAEEVRQALMLTSLFPVFSLDLAQAVTGMATVGKTLDALCERQLFTYRRGGDEPRYQYHDLFREFLQRRLRATSSPSAFRAFARRAAVLLRQRGLHEDAFPLLREAEDWDAAVEVVTEDAQRLIGQGRWRTVQDWIQTLPQDLVRSNPWLLYWAGVARMQVDVRGCRGELALAYEFFENRSDAFGQALASAAIIASYYYEYDQFAELDLWLARAFEILSDGRRFAGPHAELWIYSSVLLGATLRQPDHPFLSSIVGRLLELLNSPGEPNLAVSAGLAMVCHFGLLGEANRADNLIDRVNRLTLLDGPTALNRAYWWFYNGYYFAQKPDYGTSELAYDRADEVARDEGLTHVALLSRCFRVYHDSTAGLLESGTRALSEIPALLNEARAMDFAQYHLAACCLALAKRDGPAAAFHGRRGLEYVRGSGSPVLDVIWLGLGAHGVGLGGEHDESHRYLDEAWCRSEGRLTRFRPWLLLVRAFIGLRQSDSSACHAYLREGLRLAGALGGACFIHWLMEMKEDLFLEALRAGIEVDSVRSLIRQLHARPPKDAGEEWPWPVKILTLGRFQIIRDGEPIAFSHKTPKKPLRLLKAVIAMGGRDVPQQQVVDALWPDEEGDVAREAFTVNLHRLRRLLGDQEALRFEDGKLTLDRSRCWVDLSGLEGALSHEADDAAHADTTLKLYQGPFLPEEEDAPWVLSARERIRGKFVRYVAKVGKTLEAKDKCAQAAEWYQRGLETDDLAEELYQGLMRCHMKDNRRADAMAVYRRLRQTLSLTLGIAPSPSSERLFRELQER
jgi:LuxR family maltose regulon positive regulatory protein